MKLCILMDSLDVIKPDKDTTVAFIKRALAMQWTCYTCQIEDLVTEEGQVFANLDLVTHIDENKSSWINIHTAGYTSLSQMDIVLMRKDPPVNMAYFYATYALERLEQKGVLVANRPQSLRDVNEKYFALQFPECSPKTLVSASILKLQAFWEIHQQVIFKPMDGMGGQSVFYVDSHGSNLKVILEMLTQHQKTPIMAQVYIPEILTHGDKRILMVHGKPVPYALARKPRAGEHRGNLASGGLGQVVPLTKRDLWICDQVSPILMQKGLSFVGLDVIGDYLTEVNVTSPTCLREIEAHTGLDIAGQYLQGLV